MQYSSGTLNALKKETITSAKKYCSERREIQVPVLLCFPFFGHAMQHVYALCVCVLSHFSRVQLFATPWTIVHQAPLSMEFSRQEYWSGLPCPSPGGLPNPGIEPLAPALAGRFLTHCATWEALLYACTHMTYAHSHICLLACTHMHMVYSCLIYYVVCTPGFCSLSIMNIWGKIIFLL